MATREELPVGQEVVVYVPYSGRTQPGWVSKVARKYVTITTNREMGGHAREYDIETQRIRGDTRKFTSSEPYFRTLEQDAARKREQAARDALKALGISPNYPGPTTKSVLSVDEMEAIVDLLRRMRGAEGTSLPG